MINFVGQIVEDGLLAKRELNAPSVLHLFRYFNCSEMAEKISGIYKIQSKVKPERIYIGSGVDLMSRKRQHFSDLKCKKHHNVKLQCHANKYGLDDLLFCVVAICDRSELIPIDGIVRPEQFFIWAYNPWFNISPLAGSCLGVKREPSKVRKGWHHTEEAKLEMSKTRKGRPSPNKGKKASPETILKLKESHKGQKSPNKGRHNFISEETREKQRESAMGNKSALGYRHTQEAKDQLRNISLKLWQDPEYRKKGEEKRKNRRASPETRAKMTEAQLRRWAKIKNNGKNRVG